MVLRRNVHIQQKSDNIIHILVLVLGSKLICSCKNTGAVPNVNPQNSKKDDSQSNLKVREPCISSDRDSLSGAEYRIVE